MRRFRLHTRFILALFALSTALPAQHALAQAAPAAAPALLRGVPDSATLAAVRFRSIGPAVMSGRIADIAVPAPGHPGERLGKTVYVATSAGGVWKTTNAGVTWSPIFDDQRVSSIGAIAVAPTDSNVVWVGTGESNNLRSSSWGEGIYKSVDGGATWTHMGLRGSQHIARIVVHPSNADIVYVAAMGPLWSGGGERGFYKSTDGGRTWRNTHSLGEFTGVTDIVLDPSNPNTIYSTTYQRERKAYSFVAGGPESAIWKSTDAGETWARLASGLPAGDLGRIGIDVARTAPNTLYATIHADSGGVFRSDDAGASWTRTNPLQSIPWFFGQMRVDPTNAERVYHLGVSLSVSDDGGRTFRSIAQRTHADHHALWIDPADSDHLILGNDGGLYFSHDTGRTWDFASNLPVSTFYTIAADLREPYWVYGGLQDNGTWAAPSRTLGSAGVNNYDWLRAGGGDGFFAAIDPTNPDIVFIESQNGALSRFDATTHESKGVRPPVEDGDPPHRYNWSAPLLLSPHDHRTLYFGAQFLFRSRDHGDTWERLGGDLTRNLNRDSLPIMGLSGPGGLGRHDGTAEFGNLSSIDESPRRAGLLITGSDDGLVQISRDGGASWNRVESFPGVPDMTYVSRVIASAHDDATFYATFDGHRSNDFKPYVLKTTDYGRTWTSIASNLPDGSVYVIREHPRTPGLLFVGAEYGVFVSVDGGAAWTQVRNGIAPAPVHDLVIQPRANDLVVGTHGRGIFILDDLAPFEVLARTGTRARAAVIAQPRPAMIHGTRRSSSLFGDRNYSAQNPPTGAAIVYIAPAGTSADGSIVIADAQGAVVRELPAPLSGGIRRVQWDLRRAGPAPVPAAADGDEDDNRQQRGGQPAGPYVMPGTYTVRLHGPAAAGAAAPVLSESQIVVERDPEVPLTEAQYAQLHATRMRAYDIQVRAFAIVGELEDARRRLEAALAAGGTAAGAAAARSLVSEIDSALDRLRPPPRRQGGPQGGQQGSATQPLLTGINGVAGSIGNSHFMPTPAHLRTIEESAEAVTREAATAAALLARTAEVLPRLR